MLPRIFSVRGLLLVFGLIQLTVALLLALQVPSMLLSGNIVSWSLVCSLIITGLCLMKAEPR